MPLVLNEIKQQLDDHIGGDVRLVTHESRHRTMNTMLLYVKLSQQYSFLI
ncbi:hypothetical protein [Weissella ceti]